MQTMKHIALFAGDSGLSVGGGGNASQQPKRKKETKNKCKNDCWECERIFKCPEWEIDAELPEIDMNFPEIDMNFPEWDMDKREEEEPKQKRKAGRPKGKSGRKAVPPNQLSFECADALTRLEGLNGKRYERDKKGLTANGLTNAIIDAMRIAGGDAWRINCLPEVWLRYVKDAEGNEVKTAKGRRMIDSDATVVKPSPNKGISDIIAVFCGRFVGIEIKIGTDRQRPEQKDFQRSVEQSGGVYVIAKEFEPFYEWLSKFKRDNYLSKNDKQSVGNRLKQSGKGGCNDS